MPLVEYGRDRARTAGLRQMPCARCERWQAGHFRLAINHSASRAIPVSKLAMIEDLVMEFEECPAEHASPARQKIRDCQKGKWKTRWCH